MALSERVGTRMALLRFAAANMTTGGAEPEVEAAAALLAPSSLGLRRGLRNVGARRGRAGDAAKNVHAGNLLALDLLDCALHHVAPPLGLIRRDCPVRS
jgi:hypothetical protein